jgi:hypothetical protein
MDRTEIKAPGLKWRTRADGKPVAYWVAKPSAVAAGYPLKTVNLSSVPLDHVAVRCAVLEVEMLDWLGASRPSSFDGTLGSLLKLYQVHKDSGYRALKPSSVHVYTTYLGRLIAAHGDVRLDRMTRLDVKTWHKAWRGSDGNHLGAAKMALAVLKAAIFFGMDAGFPECERLFGSLANLRLPGPQPRTFAPTAAEIEKARASAHQMGRHGASLGYALQFETTARQWDVIGQWVALSDKRPSEVLRAGQKWVDGMRWSDIDQNMVLRFAPSKTAQTTQATVHVDLSRCPMVMEEIARIPPEARLGPLVIHEDTGLPYAHDTWQWTWRQVRGAAGLPDRMWNRDIRAGGITEAEMAGVSVDDRAKLAGHSRKINASVYSRDRLAASDRVVEARGRFRSGRK